MKKRGIVFIIIMILLLFTSCSDDSKNTISTSHVEVDKIEISGADNETVYQKFSYKRSSSIIVTAFYTDSTQKDVTREAIFNSISTVEPGIKEVVVTYVYSGKKVSSTYEVNVLPYGVDELILDTSNVKLVYQVGEKVNLAGLKVRGTYSNGTTLSISNYDVMISDVNNNKQRKDIALNRAGKYDVEITYQDGKATYPIYAYNKSEASYHFLASNSLDYLLGANIDFSSSKVAFRSPYAYVIPKGNNISYDYDAATYNDITYEAGLKIRGVNIDADTDSTDGISINLLKPADLIITLNNDDLIIRGANDSTYSYIGKRKGMTVIGISLEEGSYYLNSFGNSIIYDILFNFPQETSYNHFDSLELNSSELKKEYSFFETVDTSNIRLYGVLDGNKEVIDTSDYKIEMIYNNQLVSHFWNEGKYTIRVTYLGNTYCQNPKVEYEVTYSIKEIERYYLNMLSIDGEEIELQAQKFNYRYETSNSEITLNLSNLANAQMYVNNELYQENMKIELKDDENDISIEVRTNNNIISYILTVYHNA